MELELEMRKGKKGLSRRVCGVGEGVRLLTLEEEEGGDVGVDVVGSRGYDCGLKAHDWGGGN
jgi:hypothetical protein